MPLTLFSAYPPENTVGVRIGLNHLHHGEEIRNLDQQRTSGAGEVPKIDCLSTKECEMSELLRIELVLGMGVGCVREP
jgi:hypothetical protein